MNVLGVQRVWDREWYYDHTTMSTKAPKKKLWICPVTMCGICMRKERLQRKYAPDELIHILMQDVDTLVLREFNLLTENEKLEAKVKGLKSELDRCVKRMRMTEGQDTYEDHPPPRQYE
jgi:hypothetical protein